MMQLWMNRIRSVSVWLAMLAGIVGVTLLLMVFAGYFHTKVDATPSTRLRPAPAGAKYAVVALSAILVLLTSVTIFFRRRAVTPNEKISQEEEGWIPYLALHSSAIVLWLSTLVYLLVPSAIAWASMPIPSVFRWLSFCVAILASMPMIWTLASLGKNLTDSVVTKSDAFLVTSGPYRWVLRRP